MADSHLVLDVKFNEMSHIPPVLAILPAYNSQDYIEKAILSLLYQDYPSLRILVIDDNSTDNTLEVINRYADQIQVVHNNTNMGFAYNLNYALSIAHEEYLFILEDDVELAEPQYVKMAVKHFTDVRVALVCGQAIDFNADRLTLAKRFLARYLYYDHREKGVNGISYSMLKADLIRVSALRSIGGFGYAGNPKLGIEDQIVAKRLIDKGWFLLKDASLHYRLDFARLNGWKGVLKSERNAGKTLGAAIGQGSIDVSPAKTKEARLKSNHRRRQVAIVALIVLSAVLSVFSIRIAGIMILCCIAFAYSSYLIDSRGFSIIDKLRFAFFGLINDFIFSSAFYMGFASGIKDRFKK